jgi:hypothetical protein
MTQLPPNAYHYLAGEPPKTRPVYDIPAIVSREGIGSALVRALVRRPAAHEACDLGCEADVLDVAA